LEVPTICKGISPQFIWPEIWYVYVPPSIGSPVTPVTRPATGGAVGGGGAMAGFPRCVAAGHGGQLALDGGGHAETHHGEAAGGWGWDGDGMGMGWVRDGGDGWDGNFGEFRSVRSDFLGLGLEVG